MPRPQGFAAESTSQITGQYWGSPHSPDATSRARLVGHHSAITHGKNALIAQAAKGGLGEHPTMTIHWQSS